MARTAPSAPADAAEQIAAEKAERSRQYRASQTTRNLIAALLATLGVVVIIMLMVPRAEAPPREPIDVAGIAANVESSYDRPVLVPEVPEGWLVNGARVEPDLVPSWGVILVPDEISFVNVAQGFGGDATWAAQKLAGTAPTDTVTIDGLTWDVYEIDDPSRTGNVSYGLGLQAGDDHVLIYGSASPEVTAEVASGLSAQIKVLKETP